MPGMRAFDMARTGRIHTITVELLRDRFAAQILYMMFGLGFGGWVVYWL
jgi:hypothetical protein